jgi:hypothetical protein
MQSVAEEVRRSLSRQSDRQERQRARRAVKEAFRRVERSLARNPDLSPFGPVSLAMVQPKAIGGGGVVSEAQQTRGSAPSDQAAPKAMSAAVPPEAAAPATPSSTAPLKRRPRIRKLTPHAVVHRVRLGDAGVTCCLDHFGPDGREAFHEGTIIYINRDHPLYLRNSRRREIHTLHLTRLLTQEISLMKEPRSPRQAFEHQSKLLRDAFIDDEE